VITLFQRIIAVHKGLAVPPPPPDGQPAGTKTETGSAAAAHTTE
jgi:hypothetical protein